MVTKEQIHHGVKRFVTDEIVNKLQISPNSIRYGLVVTGINLWVDHNVANMLKDDSGAQSLGVVDENGHYDIVKIAEAFKDTMRDEGYRIELNLSGFALGDLIMHRHDIDALVQYIITA